MVIATQNPIEHEGTYPLPEAQLDRFMMRISIGYPTTEVETEILATHGVRSTLGDIGPVTDALGVQGMIQRLAPFTFPPLSAATSSTSWRPRAGTPTSIWAGALGHPSRCSAPPAPWRQPTSATS